MIVTAKRMGSSTRSVVDTTVLFARSVVAEIVSAITHVLFAAAIAADVVAMIAIESAVHAVRYTVVAAVAVIIVTIVERVAV